MEGRWFLLQNGLWLVEKQMPLYQPCIIVVLWRYKYGKIGDCKDNDDSEEFRPFLGDVSFYFSISFGFMCDASGSHQQKCASITQEPYTQTLPAHNDTSKLLSPSCDLERLREFWKRCETLIKKIINVTKKNISRPTTKAVSHQLLVNQLTDGQQVFLGAVLRSYQKSAKWYHLPPLTLLSHSDFGIIVHLNLYFIVFHHIDGTTC